MAKKIPNEIRKFQSRLAELKAQLLAAYKKEYELIWRVNLRFPNDFEPIPCGKPGLPIDLWGAKGGGGLIPDFLEDTIRTIDLKDLEQDLIKAQESYGPHTLENLPKKRTLQQAFTAFWAGIENLRHYRDWDWMPNTEETTNANGKETPIVAHKQKAKPGRKAIPGRRKAAIEFLDDWEQAKFSMDFKKFCKGKGNTLKEGHRKRKLGHYHKNKLENKN